MSREALYVTDFDAHFLLCLHFPVIDAVMRFYQKYVISRDTTHSWMPCVRHISMMLLKECDCREGEVWGLLRVLHRYGVSLFENFRRSYRKEIV